TVTTREGVTSTDRLTISVLGAPGAHMALIDSSDPVAVGDQYTYTIKVLNQSTANDIHNMTIVAVVAEETAYISADGVTSFTVAGREVRFGPVAELKPGATVVFHVKVKGTSPGAAVFNATMRWDEFGDAIVGQEGTTVFKPESSRSVQFVSLGGTTTLGVLPDSSTTKSYVANFFENKLTLQLDVDTKIALSNGQPPEQIEVKIAETGFPSGDGKVIVSPVYQISAGYDAGGNYREVSFDRPVTMTLRYDPAAVSQDGTLVHIAYFEGNPNQPEADWVRLDYPPGYVPEAGRVSGVLRHLSLFAVMAEPAPYPPPPATVPPQAAPANFEVRNLTVSPAQAKPGESISINCEVINTGGQSGEFTLRINIPGLLQTSQLITLEAGQTQAVSLTLPPGNPGTYQVDIGGTKSTFTIGTLAPVVAAPSGIQKVMAVWPIPAILAVIGAAALVYCIVIIVMRRRKYRKLLPAPAGAVSVLTQTAEQRTLYATKHQKRVAELASAIAREMNLSKKLIMMLLGVGIIHDPGSAGSPYPVAQTALQYHERLNGSGYPQRLPGDDILLEARILAVADAVETMSSPRPLRPAIGLAKALEEIKRNSSTLYDSEVVKAFARLVDQGQFRFQTRYD
ncbi:MAG: HD domain-containing phosphohydrolase, partial [Dehalococcoidia bacterium]|nr:HD domain-containing phosphohydrolase [Dehalococcoidia bacterium]